MKTIKVFIFMSSVLLISGFSRAAVETQNDFISDEPIQARYDKLAQELEKNRELLEIWKNHVRTLTQERDEAVKEAENLKTKAPEASDISSLPSAEENSQIESLQNQLQVLTRENETLRTNLAELKAASVTADAVAAPNVVENTAVQDELNLTKKSLQEAAQDREVFLRDKEAALKAADDLRSEMTSLKTENDSLKQSLSAAQTASTNQAETENSLKEKDARLEALTSQNTELQNQLAEIRTQISRLQSENQSLKQKETQLEESISQATSLQSQIQTLNQEKSDKDQTIQSLRLEMENLKSESEKKESGTQNLETQIETLKNQNLESANIIQSLENSLGTAKKENEMHEGQAARIRTLISDKEALTQKLTELETQNASLINEARSSAELRDNYEKILALNEQNKKSLEYAESEKENASKLNSELTIQQQEMKSTISSLTSENQSLRTQVLEIDALKEKNKELLGETITLKNERDIASEKLQKEKNEKEAFMRDSEAKVTTLASENANLENDLSVLKSEIQTLKAENAKVKELEEIIRTLQSDKQVALSEAAKTSDELKALRENTNSYSAQIDDLRQQNGYLKTSLTTSSKTIDELKAKLQANLADIKNLKSNFENYLESLEQSFDEQNQVSN